MNPGQTILRDAYQKRRAKNENFSLRAFARWLNVSPAQLSQMISGKRPMTMKIIKKILPKLELSPEEKQALVGSFISENNQNQDEKRVLLLEADKFKLVADWYHFAILALSRLKYAKSDPRWIAQQLGIGLSEAHLAIQRLERLGILQTKPRLKQICDPIEVVSELPSESIRKYHKQNLALAESKLESIPVQMREYQSISIVLDPEKLNVYRRLIDNLMDQATQAQDAQKNDFKRGGHQEIVYNLNVQLFPISKSN